MSLPPLIVSTNIPTYQSYTELFMQLAEPRICFLSTYHHIYGYEPDDIAQELRFRLWKQIHKYDPQKASFSTWSSTVLNNHIKNLYHHNRVDTLGRHEMRTELPD